MADVMDNSQQSATGESKREEAIKLRAEGLSYRKIAERLGVARMTVWQWLNPAPETPAAPEAVQPDGTQSELDRFCEGLPHGEALKTYLAAGNFQFESLSRRACEYNKQAMHETWGLALSLVHFLRRAAGWKVLSQQEVEASPEYKTLCHWLRRQPARLNLVCAHMAYIVNHQREESSLTEAEKLQNNCLYGFG